jgi:hypothetical protein
LAPKLAPKYAGQQVINRYRDSSLYSKAGRTQAYMTQ